jgi:hypothetical protein
MTRRALFSGFAAAAVLAVALTGPVHAAVIERFSANPLTSQGDNPFFLDGDIDGHFSYLPDEPEHFPGDREGTLRVVYDTTVPAARIATPLGQVLSLNDDFRFGAILTVRSNGFSADPDGFSQISFGLWNSVTTGIDRASFPSNSFDLVEFDYFANVSPDFGGPFLSPTVFGGNVGDNAFFNFTFRSSEVSLPFDVPLLCQLDYKVATHQLEVTVSRWAGGVFFTSMPLATAIVDLSTLQPTFLVDSLGIAAYFEGFTSLHAEVDYDLLYFGSLPAPFRVTSGRSPFERTTP